jgi:hypothetical protein
LSDSKEVAIRDEIETMDAISKLWVQGHRNPTRIAEIVKTQNNIKLTRAEVMRYIDQFKQVARDDPEVKARAKETLYEADSAVADVQKENWDLVNQPGIDDKTKATVLKNISDIEFKRVETWQKAGLYDDAALGDELAEMEEKQQVLIDILKEVTADCPTCKYEVARRLAKVTGKAEPVVIDAEVLPPSS